MKQRLNVLRPLILLPAAALLILSGCAGPGAAAPEATKSPEVKSPAPKTVTAAPSSAPAPAPGATAGAPPPGAVAAGIESVEFSGTVPKRGAPVESPRAVFDHTVDREIVAVLTLATLEPGTKISYVRYLDGKFVDTKDGNLKAKPRRFFFKFKARPGETMAVGHYLLRLYVNDRFAREVTYDVR
jgi:hypothetical protein